MLGKGHGGLYKALKREESDRLRGERDQIKLIDLRFEGWQVAGFSIMLRKALKREESDRLRGERDQIKLIDLRFEGWQVVGFRKARRQDVP